MTTGPSKPGRATLEPAFILSAALGMAAVALDDRLISLNREMPMADFEEQNLFVRLFTARLGEAAGWTALQVCGIAAFCAMTLIAFLFPWAAWAAAAVSTSGLAVVLLDLLHDTREMRLATADGFDLRPGRPRE